MAIAFPATPTVGQSYTYEGKTWVWNGRGWAAATPASLGTDLGQGTRTATTLPLTSSTGNGTTLLAATNTLAGLQSAADKTKLDGVAANATANDTDANLRNRATHTGTQTLATISDAGTAAARNVQSSPTDVTANVVLLSGAYGWGTLTATVESDLDVVRPNQVIRVASNSPANPNASIGTTVITLAEGSNFGSQLALAAGGSPAVYPIKQRIRASSTAWGPWTSYWNEANLVKQSSNLDATSGRVMLTGAFGWGTKIPLVYNTTNPFYLTDYAQYVDSGVYLGTGDGTSTPSTNGPPGSGNNALLSLALSANGATQWLAINNSGNVAGKNLFIGNFFGSSSAMSWARVWHSGNFNPTDYSTAAQVQAAIVAATTGAAITTTSGTAITVVVSDFAAGARYMRFTSTAAVVLTVAANSSQPIPIGAEITLRRAANANLTISPVSGVVVNPPAGGTLVMTQNMTATLKKVATNEWDLIGQTVAA